MAKPIIKLKFVIDGNSYFINNYSNTSLQISKTVATLDSLTSQGVITKQRFRVPFTEDLINAIGDITDPSQSANIDINKAIEGSIIVNQFPRFTGSFQVLEAFYNEKENRKELDLIFKGNETNLKQVLTDITLSELFDGVTLPYTSANIKTFLDDPDSFVSTNGYFFPLIDYGQLFTTDPNATSGTILGSTYLDQTDFKPAYTIEKLFELMPIDVTWDSSIDDLIEGQGVLMHNNESKISNLDTSPRDYTGYLYETVDTDFVDPTIQTRVTFDSKYVYNQDNFTLATDLYTAPVSGFYTINVQGQVDVLATLPVALSGTVNFFLDFDINGVPIGYIYTQSGIAFTATGTQSVYINTTIRQYLNVGQTISLSMIGSSSVNVTSFTFRYIDGFKFAITDSPQVTSTSNIIVSDNCPALNCWDVFSSIVKQCNGIIQTNQDGTYNVVPWVEWIDDNTEIIYLNDKVDSSKDIQIKPFSLDGAKKITLSYAKDEDIYSKNWTTLQSGTYGNLTIEDTGTDFTNKELKVELPFASSPLSNIPFTSFPIIKLIDEEGNCIKGKPRLIPFGGTFGTMSVSIGVKDAVTGVGTSTDYIEFPYCGHWEFTGGDIGGYNTKDYNFGQSLTYFTNEDYPNETLYERFWKQYIQETYTQDSREIKGDFYLPSITIDELEFNEVFYYKGVKFRLTQLDNIAIGSQDSITAALMKRFTIENIDIAPFYPYNVLLGIVQWKDSTDDSDLGDASGESASDVEESALAYGFAYDDNLNIANQRGIILQIN